MIRFRLGPLTLVCPLPGTNDARSQSGARKHLNKLLLLLISPLLINGAQAAPTVACAQQQVDARQTAMPWLAPGHPTRALRTASVALLDAHSHGLNPADYRATELVSRAQQLLDAGLANDSRIGQPWPRELARFNRAFTASVLCYLHQVHVGQIDVNKLHRYAWIPAKKWHALRELRQAWADENVSKLIARAPPSSPEYSRLRLALDHYRGLASLESSDPKSRFNIQRFASLKAGAQHPSIRSVRTRLNFLGDWKSSSSQTSAQTPRLDHYDDSVVSAVKRFQRRHGMAADGVLGPATQRALRVPMAVRINQLELALERMRWLPRDQSQSSIHVNLPEFSLAAKGSEFSGDGDRTFDSRVVIGRSNKYPTPLFFGKLGHIEFSPIWYVPASITKRELLPKIRRNPNYLRRVRMEVVRADGSVTQRVDDQLLQQIAAGHARIQQRSGRGNALGKVKFVLPNSRAIYLHDTNNRRLFARGRRDFSHGCVRVENPLELAKVLLKGNPKWSSGRINRAVRSSRPVIAKPAQHVDVMITYLTARVSELGEVRFLPDIYQFDRRALAMVPRWLEMSVATANRNAWPAAAPVARLNDPALVSPPSNTPGVQVNKS